MNKKQINKYCRMALEEDGYISANTKRKVFFNIDPEDISKLQAETQKIILEIERLEDDEYSEPSLYEKIMSKQRPENLSEAAVTGDLLAYDARFRH